MAWQGKSLGQICEQIKDRKRNGGKSLAQIHEHMAHDTLVGWGWAPGGDREPAPGTQERVRRACRGLDRDRRGLPGVLTRSQHTA